MKRNRYVTMKVDPDWKKTAKNLSAELDITLIRLTKNLSDYKEELIEILKEDKRRRK